MVENGATKSRENGTVFVQETGDEDLLEWAGSRVKANMLRNGYTIHVRYDDWSFRHQCGYAVD